MKKVLLTVLMIIAVFWTYGVSSAKGKDAGGQESKRSERLREEGKAKGKAAEKDSNNIDKSKTDEGAGRGRNKGEATEGAVDKGKEKGKAKEHITAKGKEQQMKALEKQLTHEEAKHRRRVARLNRIRELAVEQSDTKTLERVDKLLQMEQQRYTRMRERMQVKDERVLQVTEKNISREARKAAGTEPNEPQFKGDQQKKDKEKRDDKNANKEVEK